MHLSISDTQAVKSGGKGAYLSPDFLEKTLKTFYQARFMDEKMAKLVRQDKGGVFHLDSRGHELIGILSAFFLRPKTDWAFPYYRDRSFAFALGCSLEELFAAFLAKKAPHHSSGRMMPDHFSHKELRIPVQSSCVGSQFLQGVGCAHGIKLKNRQEVVYVSSGEGATSQGDFHEALNFASIHKLPVIFVIQDNGWAISVSSKEQTSGGCIGKIASSYADMFVEVFDGTHYLETCKALEKAVEKARSGYGPSVLVAKIPRMGAHSSSDDPKKYKSPEILEEEQKKDPLKRLEKWVLAESIFSQKQLDEWKSVAKKEVEKAAETAETFPNPCPKTVEQFVFQEVTLDETAEEPLGESVVMMDALNKALQEEMEKDPSVLVFGQDVAGGKGGVFGVTRSLTELFGEKRCFNTPLAESTIVGLAIGLSFNLAYRPVAEIQFCDYSWTAMNQLLNELSSIHYRSNGEWVCPVTIRMPYGAYIQGGPYHSQRIEGFLAHCPGLKIAIPSNASDAKRLLKASIRDPNPVIFLEHKLLYRQRVFVARPEPSSEALLPFGKAKVVKEGEHVTVVAYGMMVMMIHEIAVKLQKEGFFIELIDLRTIVPFDQNTVSQSVRKTGKLLIAQEASLFGGFGAEIAATIAKKDFAYLDAPIERIGALDTPIPYAKALEEEVLPQKSSIEKAIRKLIQY